MFTGGGKKGCPKVDFFYHGVQCWFSTSERRLTWKETSPNFCMGPHPPRRCCDSMKVTSVTPPKVMRRTQDFRKRHCHGYVLHKSITVGKAWRVREDGGKKEREKKKTENVSWEELCYSLKASKWSVLKWKIINMWNLSKQLYETFREASGNADQIKADVQVNTSPSRNSVTWCQTYSFHAFGLGAFKNRGTEGKKVQN